MSNKAVTPKIEKDEVLLKLEKIESTIKKIKKKKPHRFETLNKYLPGIGHVHELKDKVECVKAMKYINENSSKFDDNATELGLSADEIDEDEITILGFEPSVWKTDIKARLEEIKDEENLEKLKHAKKLLTKNLSKDDLFAREMNSIDDKVFDLIDDEIDVSFSDEPLQ